MTVFDFSFSRPSVEDLLAAGATGVARYLSSYSTPKNADKTEVEAYWKAGLAVLLVWENDTHDTDGGYASGAVAGHSARPQATALGFPVDHVLYWAVDRRLNNTQRATAIEYGRGFRDAAGLSRPYGEGALIDAAVDAGLCDGGWMPSTWGPCQHVVLIQQVGASPIANTDANTPQVDDWGGYHPGTPTPQPPPEDDDIMAAATPEQIQLMTEAQVLLGVKAAYELARGPGVTDKAALINAKQISAGTETFAQLEQALHDEQ